MRLPIWITASLVIVSLGLCSTASAASVNFYTNEASWQAALSSGLTLESFNTTAANVALANEVATAPGPNTSVGDFLTFDKANTGLSVSFTVEALQSGANFTFDDDETSGNIPDFDNALSVGDIHNHENDDWEVIVTDGLPLYGFGFYLRNSDSVSGESFQLFAQGGTFLDSFTGIPTSNSFVGAISTAPITRLYFNEDPGGDDIAIADFRFASGNPVPEPTTLAMLAGLSGMGLIAARRRRKAA